MRRKLIDDCFRTDARDQGRMTHADTLALIRERVRPIVRSQQVAVQNALGQALAEDITAPISVPAHTNSAVDGYAFAFADYEAATGSWFGVADRITAGATVPTTLDRHMAARIFTGAVMPASCDTVVMQEDCETKDHGDRVFIPAGLKPDANVRKAGEDVHADSTVLKAGQVIRAPEIATLNSLGISSVACFQAPRVGIVSTGDEIVRSGGVLQPGQVHDVNTPLLMALADRSIGNASDIGLWPDDRETVSKNLVAAASDFDLLITSGGASQGEEDHISHALSELGARHFWQIAVKPGRPLMLGQIGDTAVVGLPGNPVAVFVCFLMYVWPIIRQLGGLDWREPRRFPLPADFEFANRKVGRREFWRGTSKLTSDGMVVSKFPRDGSGLISGLRAADGLIDIPEDVPFIERGQPVNFIPFSEFGILD